MKRKGPEWLRRSSLPASPPAPDRSHFHPLVNYTILCLNPQCYHSQSSQSQPQSKGPNETLAPFPRYSPSLLQGPIQKQDWLRKSQPKSPQL